MFHVKHYAEKGKAALCGFSYRNITQLVRYMYFLDVCHRLILKENEDVRRFL